MTCCWQSTRTEPGRRSCSNNSIRRSRYSKPHPLSGSPTHPLTTATLRWPPTMQPSSAKPNPTILCFHGESVSSRLSLLVLNCHHLSSPSRLSLLFLTSPHSVLLVLTFSYAFLLIICPYSSSLVLNPFRDLCKRSLQLHTWVHTNTYTHMSKLYCTSLQV